jgi:hypothetical protein
MGRQYTQARPTDMDGVAERHNGFRILRQSSAAAEQMLAELLPDPDQVLAKGEICKPGSRTCGGVVFLANRRCFLKRYNDRGPCYRLRYLLRRSRAVYTWRLAKKFLACGVPVAEPFLCLEERRIRLLGRSYVLMEAAPGQVLRRLWAVLDDHHKTAVLKELGTMMGLMHRQGCLHGDLKWDNILLAYEGDQLTIRLVDLDGSRYLPWAWSRLARKDLARFIKDLRRVESEPNWELCLLEAWQAGWDSR